MTKITIDRSVVERALDAVEALEGLSNWEERILGRACDSLRQALEQSNEFHPDWDQIKPFNDRIAEQEPVAWVERDGEFVWNNREAAIGRNLYTHPPIIDKSAAVRIATTLGWGPKKEWVGLTDEDFRAMGFSSRPRAYAAIEAKLRSKNT